MSGQSRRKSAVVSPVPERSPADGRAAAAGWLGGPAWFAGAPGRLAGAACWFADEVGPLAGEDEGLGDGGPRPKLDTLEQIRFIR